MSTRNKNRESAVLKIPKTTRSKTKAGSVKNVDKDLGTMKNAGKRGIFKESQNIGRVVTRSSSSKVKDEVEKTEDKPRQKNTPVVLDDSATKPKGRSTRSAQKKDDDIHKDSAITNKNQTSGGTETRNTAVKDTKLKAESAKNKKPKTPPKSKKPPTTVAKKIGRVDEVMTRNKVSKSNEFNIKHQVSENLGTRLSQRNMNKANISKTNSTAVSAPAKRPKLAKKETAENTVVKSQKKKTIIIKADKENLVVKEKRRNNRIENIPTPNNDKGANNQTKSQHTRKLTTKKTEKETLPPPREVKGISEKGSNPRKPSTKVPMVILTKEHLSTSLLEDKKKEIFRKKYIPRKDIEVEKSPPKPDLRKKSFRNYAESSMEDSVVQEKSPLKESEDALRVPIYQKQNTQPTEEELKNTEDLYEFRFSGDSNPDVKKGKLKGKRKAKKEESYFEPPKKKTKPKRIAKKKKPVNKHSQSYDDKIREIVEVIKHKVEAKHQTPIKDTAVEMPEEQLADIQKPPMPVESEPVLGIDNRDSDSPLPLEPEISDESITKIHVEYENLKTISTDKIHILSNVVIHPRGNYEIHTPAKIREPNANSTMAEGVVLSPWRFNDTNIRRNPHFISVKPSALPHLNQEMVLDHTMVDKFNASLQSATLPNSTIVDAAKKSPVQTTIDDYFEGNKENVVLQQSSMFDNHNFSPIKQTDVSGSPGDKIKRRILGEHNEIVNASVPEPVMGEIVVTEKGNENDVSFGFATDASIQSNKNQDESPSKDTKPFRISINMNDKKYTVKVGAKKKTPAPNASECFSATEGNKDLSDSEEESDEDSSDNESLHGQKEVRLFDEADSDPPIEPIDYSFHIKLLKKSRKKANHDDFQRRKKRKDVMTKEETEALENWAQKFNSMCEEIEKFPLEIE